MARVQHHVADDRIGSSAPYSVHRPPPRVDRYTPLSAPTNTLSLSAGSTAMALTGIDGRSPLTLVHEAPPSDETKTWPPPSVEQVTQIRDRVSTWMSLT